MKTMQSNEVRQALIDFLSQNSIPMFPSSVSFHTMTPLLLFTNAGMNQFKDTF